MSFHGRLDAVGGEKVQAAVESIQQTSRPAGDTRSRAQQSADALVQLADNALASGSLPTMRGHQPTWWSPSTSTTSWTPPPAPGAGRTGFGGIISAAKARWLACGGNVTRVVIGPEGQPLDFGRTKRLFPPHLRRAVEVRDRHCVFAGCHAPTHWCDVHHLLHWIDDGETSLENAALLCERHHTKVHHGFRVERQPDGRWRTWRPDGTEIVDLRTVPRQRLTPHPAMSAAGGPTLRGRTLAGARTRRSTTAGRAPSRSGRPGGT